MRGFAGHGANRRGISWEYALARKNQRDRLLSRREVTSGGSKAKGKEPRKRGYCVGVAGRLSTSTLAKRRFHGGDRKKRKRHGMYLTFQTEDELNAEDLVRGVNWGEGLIE